MPLFVPLLRLAMLFLNIYDSYKTLRLPPPSARNGGRPSQRALTQRKRDMKGCLAVWIVWGCIMTYEGYVEGVISLFVPFYDEIKSLGLLFLIMTRARGAEPIFLHLIRPLVKPYSPTIDMILDLARMVGDIAFAILAIPTEFVCTWYKKSIFYSDTVLDSETESAQGTDASPVESTGPSLKCVGANAQNAQQLQQSIRFPKKTSSDRRRSTENPSRPHIRVDQVGLRVQGNTQGPYQIWYPPISYSDEEDAGENSARPPADEGEVGSLSSEILKEQKALDEWRKYPEFPSAYPPTPLVVSTAVLPGSSAAGARMPPIATSIMLSEILEDEPQQDFSKSLLPPRKPLNPGFVDGLSDDIYIPGVQSSHLETMSVDSDSDDEDDIFNTTLQTPMPPLRATRSGIIPAFPINREISMASSVASRSTALTTNAHDSPLRTHSSSESLSSDALSMSDLSSVLGKKRPLPPDVLDVRTNFETVRRPRADGGIRRIPISGTSLAQIPVDATSEDTESTFSTADSLEDRKPAHPKRRKVSQTPKRAIAVARPIRPRVTRYATVPTRTSIPKPPKIPPSSSRGQSGSSTRSITRRTESSVPASNVTRPNTSSADEVNGHGTRPNAKSVVKGKSRQIAPLLSSKAT